MDQKKKMSKTTKVLLVIGGVAVVAAIVILILSETVYNANASAKNASNRAFDAAYNCRFVVPSSGITASNIADSPACGKMLHYL